MTNRNIIFTAPRVAEIIERDMPEVKRGTVLVRSVRDTISPGTERANLIGDPNINSSQPEVLTSHVISDTPYPVLSRL